MDLESLQQSLIECASQAIRLAQQRGADQSEVGLNADEGLNVTVRMGETESVERQKNRGLGITVYRGQCKGSASTTDFSTSGIEAAVDKALSISRFTARDAYAGLAEPRLMATEFPDLDLYHPSGLDVAAAAKLALEAETAARDFDARIANSDGATVSTGDGIRVYANSHGFVGALPGSSQSMSCSVIAKADSTLERDYWLTSARASEDLEQAESVGRRAAERAVARLGSRQLATRIIPVLYPAELARGLLSHFVAAIRGTSQYRRASFLLDAVGREVFSAEVDIDEDPFIPRGMGSAPFDSDGVATARRPLVASGELMGYVLSAYSARRLGLQTTANAGGIHNLVVAPTAGSAEQLLAELDEVFVVCELLGQGVNTVTGD
jgi:PmbA protein